jgi:transcriptional regulator with XRE-family HTH domain
MTIEQVRAARKLLGWSRAKLALEAGISQKTVVDFEMYSGRRLGTAASTIQGALESAGVEFASEDVTGACLSKTTRLRQTRPRHDR